MWTKAYMSAIRMVCAPYLPYLLCSILRQDEKLNYAACALVWVWMEGKLGAVSKGVLISPYRRKMRM